MTPTPLRACAIATLVAGAVSGAVRTSAPAPPSNVVIVTLDTTRADRLPPYGFQSASMPAIERLADEGVLFLQAFTTAPLTLPAHCSLLTGLYPTHHHVRDNGDPPLDAMDPTLAEVLRSRGFQTAAFVSADVLGADRGLARGFETYRDITTAHVARPSARRPGNETVDEALTWLAAHDRSRFFMWVHLYDAHAPYRPPEPYRSRFATDPYEGSLAFMDAQVERVIRSLDARGQLSRTLIVVAGDHGESLGDHHELEHGFFLYDSVLRVPLIIRGPGIEPRRFTPVTTLVDVMPTILGILRIRPVSTDGLDLTTAIRRTAPVPKRAVYAESLYPEQFGVSGLRAVRDGSMKFIEAPRPELYGLDEDPFEEHNLYRPGWEKAAALAVQLDRFGGSRVKSGNAVSSEIRERLAALGYVAGGTPRAIVGDPKDYIEMYNATRRAWNRRAP